MTGMKVKCSTSGLNAAVSIVSHALGKTTNTILENILIRTIDDGLELIACDGSIIMRGTLEAEIAEEGTLLIQGKLFTDLCRKLPTGDVSLTENNNTLTVVAPPSRYKLTCADSDDFANVGELYTLLERPGLHIPQAKLKDMIGRVAFAVSQEENRPVLTGILLEATADELRLVSMNGICVALQVYHSEFVLPDGKESLSVIIPGRVMNELRGILSDDEQEMCSFHLNGNRMLCRVGNVSLVCGLISGNYVEYRKLLPANWLCRATVHCHELKQAIDRAQLIATMNSNNRVQLGLSEGELTVTAQSDNAGAEESMQAVREGVDMEISFNARFISDVMRNIEDECCMLRMSTELGPCVFEPTDGDGFLYLLAALRPR